MKQIEKNVEQYGPAVTPENQAVFLPVKERLARITPSFLDALADMSHWDSGKGGRFTGAKLCAVAAYGLHDGLAKWLPAPFGSSAKGMDIFLNTEFRPGSVGFYKEAYGFHSLLDIHHPEAGSLYVDAVHGALDDSAIGSFVFMQPHELSAKYHTSSKSGLDWAMAPWRPGSSKRPIVPADLYDITSQKDIQIPYIVGALGLKPDGYEKLVAAAAGGGV